MHPVPGIRRILCSFELANESTGRGESYTIRKLHERHPVDSFGNDYHSPKIYLYLWIWKNCESSTNILLSSFHTYGLLQVESIIGDE